MGRKLLLSKGGERNWRFKTRWHCSYRLSYLALAGVSWNNGRHVRGNDSPASKASTTQLRKVILGQKKTSDRWLWKLWPWTFRISIFRSCLLCFSSLKVSFSRPALVACRFRQCRNQLESPEEGLWIVVAHIFHVINLKKILLENKSYGKHWDIACKTNKEVVLFRPRPVHSLRSWKLEVNGLSSPGSCLGHWGPTNCPCTNGTFRSMWPTLKGGWERDGNANLIEGLVQV